MMLQQCCDLAAGRWTAASFPATPEAGATPAECTREKRGHHQRGGEAAACQLPGAADAAAAPSTKCVATLSGTETASHVSAPPRRRCGRLGGLRNRLDIGRGLLAARHGAAFTTARAPPRPRGPTRHGHGNLDGGERRTVGTPARMPRRDGLRRSGRLSRRGGRSRRCGVLGSGDVIAAAAEGPPRATTGRPAGALPQQRRDGRDEVVDGRAGGWGWNVDAVGSRCAIGRKARKERNGGSAAERLFDGGGCCCVGVGLGRGSGKGNVGTRARAGSRRSSSRAL
mmetsp:Transcript_14969/g.46378  ORF Transcript_14969/g.46378 Transcript_14969/m.46378 type:complete len:283 (+) Transcript_14969:1254-2102(+)